MANKRITDVDFISELDSNESFFINKNNTIKQISKSDIVVGIENGGTGATNVNDIRKNLDILSTNDLKNNLKNDLKNDLKSIGAQSQHIPCTATLYATKWTDNSQTVIVNGVTNKNTIIVSPNPLCKTDYGENGVFCVEQKDNALVFNCESTPLNDIQVNIIILNS